MKTNPNGIIIAKAFPNPFNALVYLLLAPSDWNAELKPCNKCNAKNTKAKLYSPTLTGLKNFSCNSWK